MCYNEEVEKRLLHLHTTIVILLGCAVTLSVFICIHEVIASKSGISITLKNTAISALPSVSSSSIPYISLNELAKHNGGDARLPIYIALNGFVYDVTDGKSYYAPRGVYHYLVGKDSSLELNFMGGDIIKEKYPIVGILSK